MRKPIVVLALLLLSTSLFAQTANNEALGGKTTESKPAPARKKPVPKSTSNQTKSLSSPCGVYYRNRADMIGQSNLGDKWFSLGQSARKHFWHNPHRTTCDAKTGVLKSWIKEVHRDSIVLPRKLSNFRYFEISVELTLDEQKGSINISGMRTAVEVKEEKLYQNTITLIKELYRIMNLRDQSSTFVD